MLLYIVLSYVINLNVVNSNQPDLSSSNYRHRRVLGTGSGWEQDGDKVKVVLEWEVDFEREIIIFDLIAWTTGYVGFGLKKSPSSSLEAAGEGGGGMAHSDIVIGGIHPNGTSYFADYYAIGNFAPVLDSSQDWDLLTAHANGTHTFLRFSRQFDTGDDQNDVLIQQSKQLQILWALGDTDQITYHGVEERAVIDMIVLISTEPEMQMPPTPPRETQTAEMFKKYPSWKTTVNVEMTEAFAYRCTFHRGPRLRKTAHAVAVTPIMNDPNARRHIHHFTFYQCKSDVDAGEIFEHLVEETGGNDCYSSDDKIPVHLCMQSLYVWCPGEKGMFFPEEAGYLLKNDEDSVDIFFMFEIHYENPAEMYNGVTFEAGIQIFYTEELRKFDAGFLGIGHAVSDSLFIPPNAESFRIEGRCCSECTQNSVPNEGVTVISVMLHAHQYARKIKLRHFRNGNELPSLAEENQFDFNSQKMWRLPEERKILPGDNLVVECEYNTLSRSSVTTGGFESKFEMCTAFLWYFPKIDLDDCSSGFPLEELHNVFGYEVPKEDTPWNVGKSQNFPSFINQNVKWTQKLREHIQKLFTESNHRASCIIPNHQKFDNMVAQPAAVKHAK